MNAVRLSVARWVSIIAHPFAMMAVVVGATTARVGSSNEVAANVGIVALFAILPVAVLMIDRVRRGAWASVDASSLHERPSLYLTGILGILALVCFLAATRSVLLRAAVVTLVVLLLCGVTTRWIKVSLHVTAAALTATTLLLSGSRAGWIVLPVVPLLCWSRLALRRHSPSEIAVGLGFGFVGGAAIHFP
jgi:membrane-associated phospholipid phosphatase